MIKEQVWKVSLVTNYEFWLPSYECEATSEFKQETSYVFCNCIFQVTLSITSFQCKEIQTIWVLQNIHCKLTLLCWQLVREVCYGMTMLAEIISLDNVFQFTFAESFVYNTCNIIECFFDGFTLRCND